MQAHRLAYIRSGDVLAMLFVNVLPHFAHRLWVVTQRCEFTYLTFVAGNRLFTIVNTAGERADNAGRVNELMGTNAIPSPPLLAVLLEGVVSIGAIEAILANLHQCRTDISEQYHQKRITRPYGEQAAPCLARRRCGRMYGPYTHRTVRRTVR